MNAGGRPLMLRDRVRKMASPLTNIIEVSVTMKAGSSSRATARPLNRPTAAPASSIAATPAGTASGLPASQPSLAFITTAPVTLASAMVEVCDRSMPPASSTSSWPTARRSAAAAASASRFARFSGRPSAGAKRQQEQRSTRARRPAPGARREGPSRAWSAPATSSRSRPTSAAPASQVALVDDEARIADQLGHRLARPLVEQGLDRGACLEGDILHAGGVEIAVRRACGTRSRRRRSRRAPRGRARRPSGSGRRPAAPRRPTGTGSPTR